MRRWPPLLAVLTLVFLGCTASASGSPSASVTTSPAPTSGSTAAPPSASGPGFGGVAAVVPPGWITFTDPDGAFSVALPAQPTTTDAQATVAPSGPISSTEYQWRASDGVISYIVTVTDYPAGYLSSQTAQTALGASAQNYATGFGADMAGQQATMVGSHPALDVVMTNTGGYICIRFVIVADRLYVLGGTDTHQCPADMPGFAGSFRLTSP
jgi:hypothetical protein